MTLGGKLGWALVAALSLLLIAMLAGGVEGGPLDPPNPLGPSMKTLEEVEPRTPISSLPVVISTPGAYYLTDNLACNACASVAINITADNVDLDLNGFTMTCAPAPCSSTEGIVSGSTPRIIRIHDGTIRGFRNGILAQPVVSSVFEDLNVYDNQSTGIAVEGENNVIRRCRAQYNSTGVSMGNGAGVYQGGGIVEDCTFMANSGFGLRLFSGVEVRNNTALGNTGAVAIEAAGPDNDIHDNNVVGNSVGIKLPATGGNNMYRNSASGNTTNYDVGIGNTVGPIGGADTATSPWANLTY
jgi:parallel beta-helix repeat protein